ncbi:sulfite exporter TauE/SafE family protein [Lonepinella koalarum]|uniref:Probable membrane transporter protein n=1 Tax=Lonepinella koalarum TaxID=53417 RepID=A0A4R1L376_9PAST|nr:sulfite exporter TauE/SafE family protein [Lonepinella koalarum]MDH2926690.1 hypothetical protein [Lonepinella koalarum]TCK70649.1 hypothetical protein EV692_0937 [Lonepinella koalarum]TFJ89972.1 sulfite exporter TauE/SafE family protein [Lonepinella koalarum]
MTITMISVLMLSGIMTNIVSALFGIGGGVLMVPILRTLFPNIPMQIIAATSLTIVMSTSLINLILFRRQHISINIKSMLLWSIGMIIGVQLGFELSFILAETGIVSIFVITLILLALKTFLSKRKNYENTQKADKKEHFTGMLVCAFGGFIAGITGIGGGSIMAPLVNQLKSVQTKQIAVYTNYMMFIGGLGSLIGYISRQVDLPKELSGSWQIGYVNFTIVAIVVSTSFAMSFFSMKLRGKLSSQVTTRLLAWILLMIASYMAILQWYS